MVTTEHSTPERREVELSGFFPIPHMSTDDRSFGLMLSSKINLPAVTLASFHAYSKNTLPNVDIFGFLIPEKKGCELRLAFSSSAGQSATTFSSQSLSLYDQRNGVTSTRCVIQSRKTFSTRTEYKSVKVPKYGSYR